MEKNDKIYIAGHNGLVGSALLKRLLSENYNNIVVRNHKELDLTNQLDVVKFLNKEKPKYVIIAAAKVGGIMANYEYPADFIYQNIMISSNLIRTSYEVGVEKLINLGSSCIYPKYASQPIKEESLLTGLLEPTNEAYAIAKISAIKLCHYFNKQYGTNFISLMPTNLYGPNDNFDKNTSHVLPGLIAKFNNAKTNKTMDNISDVDKEVVLWGDGSPKREFLHVDDLADAIVYILKYYNAIEIGEIINIGTGKDITIKELAIMISNIVGYTGNIKWDKSKPNGTPRKVLEVSKINKLGWRYNIDLVEGIKMTNNWFISNYDNGKNK